MSYVKLMMDEAKTFLLILLRLSHIYILKLLRGAMRVLLACFRLVVLTLALPLLSQEIFDIVTEEITTEEKKA